MSSKGIRDNNIIWIIGIIVVLIFGYVYNSDTKTYSGNGISFNYSADWQISFPDTSGAGTSFSVAVYNYNIVFSYIYPFINFIPTGTDVQIISMPSNASIQDVINKAKNFTVRDLTKISNGTLTIDGNTAYQVTCVDNINGPNKKRYEGISFVKNGKLYSLFLQAPDSEFDKEKPKFDMILNSLKVE